MFHSIEKAYLAVQPPVVPGAGNAMMRTLGSAEGVSPQLLNALSPAEVAFASLFCNGVARTSIMHDLRILSECLIAQDLFSCM